MAASPVLTPATPSLSRQAALPPGRERCQGHGGGSIRLGLQAGDRLTVLDP